MAVCDSPSCACNARNWLRCEIRPGEAFRGPTTSVSIRLQQLAGESHESQSFAGRSGQRYGVGECFDKPGPLPAAAWPTGRQSRLRFHEPVGAAEHARLPFEIDGKGVGSLCCRRFSGTAKKTPDPFSVVEPHEAHAAAEPARFGLQSVPQLIALRGPQRVVPMCPARFRPTAPPRR